MKKSQFIKIAFELGYGCRYSGNTKTFYLTPLLDFDEVPGDKEFFDGLYSELDNSGFKYKIQE